MGEQTSNSCICKRPLARFWSNPATQPMSLLIYVAAQGENARSSKEVRGKKSPAADAESYPQAH